MGIVLDMETLEVYDDGVLFDDLREGSEYICYGCGSFWSQDRLYHKYSNGSAVSVAIKIMQADENPVCDKCW